MTMSFASDPASGVAPSAPAPGEVYQKGDTNVIEMPLNTDNGGRPSWLPGKFKSPEDLAKAYGELETKLSQGGAAPAQPAQVPQAPAAAPLAGDDLLKAGATAPQAAPAAPKTGEGPKPTGAAAAIAAASEAFAASGKLDDAQMQALAAAGIPKEVVDTFVATHTQAQQATEAFVFGQFGGKDAFRAALEGARGSLTQAEMDAFDGAMKSRDFGRVSMAVNFLKAKSGGTSRLVPPDGGARAPAADQPFGVGEFEAAVRDSRYASDPAFRAQVERRVAAGLRR